MTAPAAKGGRGLAIWGILAAVLAVPGLLYYNWWSRQKAEHDRGVSAKAHARLPEGGVFQTPPAAGRLVNPMSPSASAEASAPAPVAPAASAKASAPAVPARPAAPAPARPAPAVADLSVVTPAAAAPAPPPAPKAAAPAAPVAAPASEAGSAPASVAVAGSTAPAAALRDPMQSPSDVLRLREAEAEELLARQREEEAARERAHPRPPPRKKEPRVEDRVALQGIVAKSDGHNLAIVNGSMLNVGESFKVMGVDGKVKVLGITSVAVTFEHKNRRFTKSVSRSIR